MSRYAAAASALAAMITLAFAGAASAQSYETAGPANASTDSRYSLVHGCFALRSSTTGGFVTKAGGGYDTSAASAGAAEKFRMQATDLGRYLFYGLDRDVMTGQALGGVVPQAQATDGADWTVTGSGNSFRITNSFINRDLAVTDGSLAAVAQGSAGDAGVFSFVAATGCPDYPEVNINVEGPQSTKFPPYADTQGMVEAHMHHMAFEFLGGGAHCGRPWHKFGAPYALVDCIDHQPNGCAAILETAVSDSGCHDPTGWPKFTDWPRPSSLTHEQSYYRWVERAHRAGLRVFVQLNVENRVLCEIYKTYATSRNSCDEMDSVRLQIKDAYALQRYVDAQSGGPGKGWYQIVHDPYEARRAINRGKLAVVLGMEVSEPFGCSKPAGIPACDEQDITDGIQELYDMGVRQMELVNKFDNALTGVAGDGGSTGVLTNTGNVYSAGSFWDLDTCEDPANHDHSPTALEHNDDALSGAVLSLLPGGAVPVYPPGPHCNQAGLTALGEHAIREMAKRGMIFDPDHMSVLARNSALDVIDSINYPGTVSSHSWSTPNALPRIYNEGGFVAPYAGGSEGFVNKWREAKAAYSGPEKYFGIGWGADQNGLGSQGGPRGADVPNPVTYPFRSADGKQIIGRQVSGEKVYDFNTSGVAHYGMYADWVEDLRILAGDEIIDDLLQGSEAYLETWERAEGVAPRGCNAYTPNFSRRGLGGRFRLGLDATDALKRGGQPQSRSRAYRYCTRKGRTLRNVAVVFHKDRTAGMILSTLRANRAGKLRPGDRAAKVRRLARRGALTKVTPKIFVRGIGGGNKYVYVVRKGKVKAVGVAGKRTSYNAKVLRRHIGFSGLA